MFHASYVCAAAKVKLSPHHTGVHVQVLRQGKLEQYERATDYFTVTSFLPVSSANRVEHQIPEPRPGKVGRMGWARVQYVHQARQQRSFCDQLTSELCGIVEVWTFGTGSSALLHAQRSFCTESLGLGPVCNCDNLLSQTVYRIFV